MNILIILFGYLLIFGLSEFLHYRFSWQSEHTRKVAHIGSSLFSLVVPHLVTRIQITGIGIFFFIILLITKKTFFLRSVHQVPRRTLGALFFPVTIVVLAWLTWPENLPAYYYAVLILGFSDTLAAVFGRGKKTSQELNLLSSWRGSLVHFLMTVIIGLGILTYYGQPVSILSLLAVSFTLMLVERYSPYGVDNITVPIAAVFLFQFLSIS